MFVALLGLVVGPLLLLVFQSHYAKAAASWNLPIIAGAVAFGGVWAVVALLGWEEANGGDTFLSVIGKILGMMVFVYGGLVAVGSGMAAHQDSKDNSGPQG